jgi:hypothetical protein
MRSQILFFLPFALFGCVIMQKTETVPYQRRSSGLDDHNGNVPDIYVASENKIPFSTKLLRRTEKNEEILGRTIAHAEGMLSSFFLIERCFYASLIDIIKMIRTPY